MGAVLYLLNSVNYELVVVVMGLLVLLPFLIMHRYALHKGAQPLATIGLVAIAMASAWRNYPPRPALLNPLFFAVLVIMIDKARSRRAGHASWMPVALVIPMMFVWANVQAGFMIGLAVLAAWAAVAIVERRNRLVAVGAALGAALVGLINAYGWHLYTYTISSSFGAKPDRLYVQEWFSPDFHSPLNWPFLPAMILALYVGLRSMDVFIRVLLVATLCAALISMRFQPFFAVALILAVAPQLPATRLPKLPVLRAMAFGSALVIGFLALLFVVAATSVTSTSQAPARGLAFLRANYPDEHVLASITFSNWLVYQDYPVFVDGRTTQVYPDQLMQDYFKVDLVQGNWEDVLNKHDINIVMTERDSRLAAALSFKRWNQVFAGKVELIFVRPGFRVSTGPP